MGVEAVFVQWLERDPMGVEAMVAQCLERDPMGVRDSGGAMFGEGSPAPTPPWEVK